MDNLMQDMVRDIAERGVVEKEAAVKALRALSRWYGGQLLYIPKSRESGQAEDIWGLMADEVGDRDATIIYDILSRLYGGVQHYIPMERTAFADDLAKEILEEYDGTVESMRGLCRRYGISFSQVYRLYHKGREIRSRQMEFVF